MIEDAKDKLLDLMADGRWRNMNDILMKLQYPEGVLKTALFQLTMGKHLESERSGGDVNLGQMWRMPDDES